MVCHRRWRLPGEASTAADESASPDQADRTVTIARWRSKRRGLPAPRERARGSRRPRASSASLLSTSPSSWRPRWVLLPCTAGRLPSVRLLPSLRPLARKPHRVPAPPTDPRPDPPSRHESRGTLDGRTGRCVSGVARVTVAPTLRPTTRRRTRTARRAAPTRSSTRPGSVDSASGTRQRRRPPNKKPPPLSSTGGTAPRRGRRRRPAGASTRRAPRPPRTDGATARR